MLLLLELLLLMILLLLRSAPLESYRIIPDRGSGDSKIGAPGLSFFHLGPFFSLVWHSRSIFLRPASMLHSNLARPTSILLAWTLPGTAWTSFLEAEMG